MVRSLSLIHLFVILSISYIGGALLFREMSVEASESLLYFLDRRIIEHESSVLWTLLSVILFFLIAYVFSIDKRTRPVVLLIGALKGVIFGLSSSYLLSTGMGMIQYAVWWFPFQFIICFLLLIYCFVLSPPYFERVHSRKRRNLRSLPILLTFFVCVQIIETLIYQFFIK
ncbi:hypothetical protein [Sporosarcina sp. Te-1]|uniref:hypothetical protein n=1 Tax=Sporosarcina sp. Te-1 TaxID=2818390 RepID=UPI001A9CD75E|nr:hypothetical protein [Sporosarcina sp. Te-1]QTD42226.1 hypothetical protein J3U78_05230 [Sporosarcina sp. Te-1]